MEDIALQQYGSVDGVTLLFVDNETVFTDGYCTELAAGTVLSIRDTAVNKPVYETARRLGVVPATDTSDDIIAPNGLGDYDPDGHNDSFFTTT